MILPTEHIPPARSLLGVGARILDALRAEMTVSELWDRIRAQPKTGPGAPITYGWFVLALDVLYLIGAVEFHDGILRRRKP